MNETYGLVILFAIAISVKDLAHKQLIAATCHPYQLLGFGSMQRFASLWPTCFLLCAATCLL